MKQDLQQLIADFPRQFWVLFGGTVINSTGSGMIFPFLTLYLHDQLKFSVTVVGVILSLWAFSALIGQLIGGALTDQFGRKRLMAFSLGTNALVLIAFGFANSFATAALVVIAAGFVSALYQPARDAMVADLVTPDKRTQAYGLLRVVANLGVAIGPAIGGLLASRSYLVSFLAAASATGIYFLITTVAMHETKPATVARHANAPAPGNFITVFRDTHFVVFCIAGILGAILAAQMMTVLPVYMKDQFGLDAGYYGWVMTTNAGMVVVLQLAIMRATNRVPRLLLAAIGVTLYAIGVASIAGGTAFPHFIAAMVIFTFGEMILVPTMTAVTADLAPADLRGRYMGMLGLTWSAGFGIGPIFGGVITDNFTPQTLWLITPIVGIVAAALYLALAQIIPTHTTHPTTET